eukprot:32187-Eustigmatos_ZCMA.PRE.1
MQRAKSVAPGVDEAAANLLREEDGQKEKRTVMIYARDQDGRELSFLVSMRTLETLQLLKNA